MLCRFGEESCDPKLFSHVLPCLLCLLWLCQMNQVLGNAGQIKKAPCQAAKDMVSSGRSVNLVQVAQLLRSEALGLHQNNSRASCLVLQDAEAACQDVHHCLVGL